MDLLDWLIVLLTVASAIHGLRLGAAVQLLSFAGSLVGLVLGVVLVSVLTPHFHGHARTFASLLLLLLPCGILWAVGRQVGARLWGQIQGRRIARLDAGAGAAIAMAGTLVFSWLIASVLVNSPVAVVADQIQHSRILEGVTTVMPPVPTELASLERLLNQDGFPLPLIDFQGPQAPVKMPGAAAVEAAVKRDGRSTVRVVAYGCDHGDIVEKGTGFVVDHDLVVTNAHVVAGADRVVVADEFQYHSATPILFDPRFDLAVLRVKGLTDPSLRLDAHFVNRGTKAVFLGYPGGGPFNAQPAGVLQRIDATGFDIYNRHETTRWLYELQALVRPGNSGSPLVNSKGTVVGVVFSRLSTNDHIGFALNSPGVLRRVQKAAALPADAVAGTGHCTS